MKKMLDFDLLKLKNDFTNISLIVTSEIFYLLIIAISFVLNIKVSYYAMVILSIIMTTSIMYKLILSLEEKRFELIYEKIIYYPIFKKYFFKSKLLIMFYFMVFQNLYLSFCLAIGTAINGEKLELKKWLISIIITCISILSTSGLIILLSGKTKNALFVSMFTLSIMVVSIEYINSLVLINPIYSIFILLISIIVYILFYPATIWLQKYLL